MVTIWKKSRISRLIHTDQFSGIRYGEFAIDGEGIGLLDYDFRNQLWLEKLSDTALTEIRDCFKNIRLQKERSKAEIEKLATLVSALSSSQL